jgi:hypothetical protein
MGSMVKTRWVPHVPVLSPPPGDDYGDAVNGRTKNRRGSGLSACPFCRELFTDGEHETCPECGLALADLTALPPSNDATVLMHEEAAAATQAHHAPIAAIADVTPLPLRDMSRNRGVLLACAAVGFTLFFLPWARMTMPDTVQFSGLDLARSRPFFWSSLAAWVVLVPSVISRRTVLQMVGARLACALLAAVPGVQAALLLASPTKKVVRGVPYELHWQPTLHVAIVVSVVATIAAFGFGGRLDAQRADREG